LNWHQPQEYQTGATAILDQEPPWDWGRTQCSGCQANLPNRRHEVDYHQTHK
jgi:hypothetical protein